MSLDLRPTFTTDLRETSADVAVRLRDGLSREPVWVKWARVPGARAEQSDGNHFVLIAMPENQQRFFSPWLQISITPVESGTQLFGRFSPRPAVWTAFALSYLFLGCVAFFSSMLGFAQLMVKQSPWVFWITLGALILIGVLWWASQTGKRLADEQMATLKHAVDESLKQAGAPKNDSRDVSPRESL